MEVHAHTHTERKKWTHYVWEFLMLFLAVFCGFLAENFREHRVELQREKQFIQSLFNDIKTDTSNIARIINARTVREHVLDSFSHLMNSDSSKYHLKQIYTYAISASRTLPYRFIPNDGTIQQLKNSGAFRLIRKREVVDSIAKYDVNVRNMVGQWSVEETLIDHYRTASSKIFDALVFDHMFDDNLNYIGLPSFVPRLQAFNQRELYEWNYRLYAMKTIGRANRLYLLLLLRQAKNLLVILEKEYHLK